MDELQDEYISVRPMRVKEIAYVRREALDEARTWARRMYQRVLKAEAERDAWKALADSLEADRDDLMKRVRYDSSGPIFYVREGETFKIGNIDWRLSTGTGDIVGDS